MKIYKWNGERWCIDDRSIWKRLRQWVVWVGGWELAHGLGWALRNGMPPWPVSVFGHRLIHYGHWSSAKTPWGTLVINWRERYSFISHDGTPQSAHIWLWNAPREVRAAVAIPGAGTPEEPAPSSPTDFPVAPCVWGWSPFLEPPPCSTAPHRWPDIDADEVDEWLDAKGIDADKHAPNYTVCRCSRYPEPHVHGARH